MNKREHFDIPRYKKFDTLNADVDGYILVNEIDGNLLLPLEDIKITTNVLLPLSSMKFSLGGFFEEISMDKRVIGGYEIFLNLKRASRLKSENSNSIYKCKIPKGTKTVYKFGIIVAETAVIIEKI